MENEKETVIPVRKKVVLKRKPVVKKEVVVKEVVQEEVPASENQVEVVSEVVQSTPEVEKTEEVKVHKGPKAHKKRPQKEEKTSEVAEAEEKQETEVKAENTEETKVEEAKTEESKVQDDNQKNKGKNPNNKQKKILTMDDVTVSEEEYNSHLENRILVNDLTIMPVNNLKMMLSEMTETPVDEFAELKKQEVIVEIAKNHIQKEGVIYAIGTLEVLSDGYGFLRSPLNSYLSGPEDVYLSASMIRFLNLKTGDTIEGIIRNPKDNERFFAMSKIAKVNSDLPIIAKTRAPFDSLIPLYPDSRINLETERTDDDVSMRIINLFCPIGKGQRALITAPPRTGKTILLQQIANAITTNHPDVHLIVLLVDERPEEVTDMRRNVKGEVIASTFDEQATRHVQVAEMVIEKAKRLVEHKQDVVILLDSITRLARAYNQTVPASGKILSGGVDSNALHKPKRFFGAARNIENGGSLTIIASALIETGSRMDEVIFEEFKGTGNSEIVLDRMMAERRLFPAINIKKSGTRREDLLLEQEEANRIWILRNNVLNGLEDYDITRLLVDKMRKTKNNEAFLRSMNTGAVPAN